MDQVNLCYATLVRIDKELAATLTVMRHALIEANQEIQRLKAEVEALRKAKS